MIDVLLLKDGIHMFFFLEKDDKYFIRQLNINFRKNALETKIITEVAAKNLKNTKHEWLIYD